MLRRNGLDRRLFQGLACGFFRSDCLSDTDFILAFDDDLIANLRDPTKTIKQQAGVHSQLIANVIDAAAKAIEADDRPEIYTSGADNIFRYPELADQSKASRIIGDFEEKQVLGNIVRETLADPDTEGIQVYIGGEVPARGQGMEDCSVVTATYELSEGMKGTIGIIGPKRMDYDKVVDVMKQIMTQLDDYYKQ